MPNFTKAVIYKLISANAPNLIYYGSTTTTLKVRLSQHVYKARPDTKGSCSSRHVINAGAYSIHELQKAPCTSKKELEAIERQFIEGRHCANERVPGRTKKESNKAHYLANAETQKAQVKARQAWRRSFGYWATNQYGTLCDIHPTLFN